MVSGLCCQKTMKNTGNFIYILRCWPGYSMLSTVTSTTMDTQGFQNFGRQTSVLKALLLPLPIQLSSAPCRFKLLRKKTSTSDKHISVLFCLRLCFQ